MGAYYAFDTPEELEKCAAILKLLQKSLPAIRSSCADEDEKFAHPIGR